MKQSLLLLLLLATLEACGAVKLPRRPGNRGNRPAGDGSEVEQPAANGGVETTTAGVGEGSSPTTQQQPTVQRPLPPVQQRTPLQLGSARPEIAPRPSTEVDLPPGIRRPPPDWLKAAPPGTEFQVDFGGTATPIPSGLHAGMNDMLQSSDGAWQVWGEGLPAEGAGLARLWLRYHRSGLNNEHFRAAKAANDAGLGLFFTVSGYPGKSDGDELRALKSEREINDWCQLVATDVGKLRERGLTVNYIEIWNEPDWPENWSGTQQEFATFFAKAGRGLRKLLPAGTRIGGAGMAAGYGGGRRQFRLMLEACVHHGFEPDFLSWHDYPGLPTDQEALKIVEDNRYLADASGLTIPEMIVSEWQLGMPANPALEDHRGAANFVAMFNGLARTEMQNSMFFFLQDGNWESKSDFDGGHSLGVFTLNGAPKSIFAGIRLVRQAAEYPMVPSARVGAPTNLSMIATREGDRGYVLATNISGKSEFAARKLAEMRGIDMTQYSGKDTILMRYMKGEVGFSAVGGPAADEELWESVRRFVSVQSREQNLRERWLKLSTTDAPSRVGKVWIIDATHGNPKASQSFRQEFQPYTEGLRTVAMNNARAQSIAQGAPASEVDALIRAMRAKDKPAQARVPKSTRDIAQAAYKNELDRLNREVSPQFAAHADASAALVNSQGHVRLNGNRLDLQLPPGTTLLVELIWD